MQHREIAPALATQPLCPWFSSFSALFHVCPSSPVLWIVPLNRELADKILPQGSVSHEPCPKMDGEQRT